MRRLAFADGLRALAALWVVLFHLSEGKHIPELLLALPNWIKTALFDAGHLGVPVFFVLIGFVLVITANTMSFDGPNSLRFVSRRLVRLAPPYYFAIGISVLAALFKAKVMNADIDLPGFVDIAAHFAYAQAFMGIPQINTVFWTLSIEVQFYLFFALHCWLAGRGRLIDLDQKKALLLAMSASAVLSLAWPTGLVSTPLWVGGFIGFWNAFIAGALVGWAFCNKRAIGFVFLYAVLLICIGIYRSDSLTFVAGITAFLLIVAMHFDAMQKWLSWRWLQNLALCSYSLYLLHGPVTGVSVRLLRKLAPLSLMGDIVTLFVAPSLCVAFSYVSYKIIELPSIGWSRKIFLNKEA